MILVDTNVLLDVLTADPVWYDWSERELERAGLAGPVLINDVVYAELSVRASRMEDVDAFLQASGVDVAPTPRAALFLAGKAFAAYRARGGSRTGVLPDLFIGAHAAVEGWDLLTRDPRRFRVAFPKLRLIAP